MPNHVLNELRINAPLEAVAPLTINAKGELDFEVLLPPPLNFWWGNVSADHKTTFPGTALDWGTKNWGTKWGPYGIDEGGKYKSVVEQGGATALTFKTAWSPPMGWIVALFNTLRCRMTLTWFDEGRDNAFVDRFWMESGPLGGPQWGRDAAIEEETDRMAALYWGAETWIEIKAERESD